MSFGIEYLSGPSEHLLKKKLAEIFSSSNSFSIKGYDVPDKSLIPNTTTAIHIPEIIAPIVKDGTCSVCLLLFFGESFFSEIV